MKSNNIFTNLGRFAADCTQNFRDGYKLVNGQWAAEEKQMEELRILNEAKLVDNGFISNVARVRGLESKLYQDSMNARPTEDTIAALNCFQELLAAEERRQKALQRRVKRNKAIILETLLQIVILGSIAYLASSFTEIACYRQQRDSTYCQQVKSVQRYFLGSGKIFPNPL